MKPLLRKYLALLVVLTMVVVATLFKRDFGESVVTLTLAQLKEMLLVIPPIFVLLGLLDVWVPKETMVKYMGDDSGVRGVVLAFLIGSAAAGPLYGAFPVAAVFLKKGVKFTNILIFIGAWSTTKVPMFLFEISALGPAFAITRLLIDIPGIIIIARILARIVPQEEIRRLYQAASGEEVRTAP